MSNIEQAEQRMNELILAGDVMDAFEEYLTEDVVMQDNGAEPTVGKEANREREHEFFASVDEIHGVELLDGATGDGVSYSEWEYDITFEGGERTQWVQVERRQWNDDGKVEHVRFYYNPPYS